MWRYRRPLVMIRHSYGRGLCRNARSRPAADAAGRASTQKQTVYRVVRLFDVWVGEFGEKGLEVVSIGRRHLYAHQHPTVRGAVIAVVKQADVPALAYAGEKAQQRAGPLGKFETENKFLDDARRASADQKPHVQLGHIDLGDAAGTDGLAERAKAAGPFRYRHREDGLVALADLGALRDMAQAIEVHVGAAVDGHEVLALYPRALDVALHARDRQRAGRRGDGARVVEDIFDGGADLVCADQYHVVHALTRDAKRLFADLPHGHAVGEDAHLIQHHALLALQRAIQGRRIIGLDADDLHLGIERLHITRHTRDETAAAHRHDDRVQRRLMLTQYLHRHRALARDHLRVVVGMDEHHALFIGELDRADIGLVVCVAVQHRLRAELAHRLHLDVGRGARHDDERLDAEAVRRQRHPLRMVAGRRGDHAARTLLRTHVHDLVIGAAQLEGEHGLQVLALQQHVIAHTLGQAAHHIERRLYRHVVDPRLENFFEIILGHRNTVTAWSPH